MYNNLIVLKYHLELMEDLVILILEEILNNLIILNSMYHKIIDFMKLD